MPNITYGRGAFDTRSWIRSRPFPSGRPKSMMANDGRYTCKCRRADRRLSARRMRAPLRRHSNRIASHAKRLSSITRTVSPSKGRFAVGAGKFGAKGSLISIIKPHTVIYDSGNYARLPNSTLTNLGSQRCLERLSSRGCGGASLALVRYGPHKAAT